MTRAEPQLDSPSMLRLEPGRLIGLLGTPGLGLTQVGLSLLAPTAQRATVAYLDVRGWFCPVAAWESGISPERLVVVRCHQQQLWPQVMAALLEGLPAIYAEVPTGTREDILRRLAALARARGSAAAIRPLSGTIPAGVAHLTVRGMEVAWRGTEVGFGRLEGRRLTLAVGGRGMGGSERMVEMEDDGKDALRLVSGLAASQIGRAAG